MPSPHQRSSEKKFVKTKGKGNRTHYFKGKPKKHSCAICKSTLHGVPHSLGKNAVSKLSKTKKRPSVSFGGVLCSKCRTNVFEEAIKVNQKTKLAKNVSFKVKKFVEMAVLKAGI